MDKFTTLEGVAAPLKIINVDTDMIIPKQYLKTIKRTGLGKGLFSEQRYNDDGAFAGDAGGDAQRRGPTIGRGLSAVCKKCLWNRGSSTAILRAVGRISVA